VDIERVQDSLSVDLEDVDRIIVSIVAGEVTVTAGEHPHLEVRRESGDEVHVRRADGLLHVAQPDPTHSGFDRLLSLFGSGRRQRCTVSIVAPPSASIELTAVSGTIVASGFSGGSKIKTVSGDVTLSKLGGKVDVKTVSGDVDAKDAGEELKLKSVSGDLSVVDGVCRRVDSKSVSGDVLLDLDLDPTGSYDVTTVSGSVSLRAKGELNLTVDAKSVSGSYMSDFGGEWIREPGRRTVHHTIGNGGARMWVKTVSGDLRLIRGREVGAA
jgi:Putative adhesin